MNPFDRMHFLDQDVTKVVQDAIVIVGVDEQPLTGAHYEAIKSVEGDIFAQNCQEKLKCTSAGEIIIENTAKILAKHVMVMVCPIWNGGGWGEDNYLMKGIAKCLSSADTLECHSIAVSTSSMNDCLYPGSHACRILIRTVAHALVGFRHMSVIFLGSGLEHAYCSEMSRQNSLQSDSNIQRRIIGMEVGLKVVMADITQLGICAIVNAAKNSLLGGGGVDGAIHQAAGPQLLEECRRLGGCSTGRAVVTNGYELPCKFVIHTVGPIWRGGTCNEEGNLASCYMSSLELAVEKGCENVAFPCVSCGVYGFPKELAAQIAVRSVLQFKQFTNCEIGVTFCCFDSFNFGLYEAILQRNASSGASRSDIAKS